MMNEFRPNEGDSRLDAAIAAMRNLEIPTDPVERIKIKARALSHVQEVTPLAPRRSKRLAAAGWLASIAATMALAIGTIVWLAVPTSASAFAAMVQNAKKAQSVKGVIQFQTATRTDESPFYFQGNKARIEFAKGALVRLIDFDQKKLVVLENYKKSYGIGKTGNDPSMGNNNPVEQLSQAKTSEAKQIGEEWLDKKLTQVYRVGKFNMMGIRGEGTMTVWVDKETGLPLKIVIADTDPKHESEIRFERMVWNEPIDAALFSMAIPDGYQLAKDSIAGPNEPRVPATVTKIQKLADDNLQGLDFHRAVAKILWIKPDQVTVLLRDAEKTPRDQFKQHELFQVDLASGQKVWSEVVAGTSTVAATPDGSKLITVIGREIQIRAGATGKIESTLVDKTMPGTWALSPDGTTLATSIANWDVKESGPKGGVRIWDLNKKVITQSASEDNPTTFVTFTPDGKRVVTSSNLGTVRLWDAQKGNLVSVYPGIYPAAFSKQGEYLAMAGADPTKERTITQVDIYRSQGGEKVKSLISDAGSSASTVLGLAFSPDGKQVAAVDWNGRVLIWDLTTGKLDPTKRAHEGGVLSLSFSPDGKTIASGSEDGTLRLWTLSPEGK